MTIASTTIKTGPLEGDGSTNSFTYTFTVKNSTHMKVIHTTALGVETTLSASAYTVNNVGDIGGGTVTYPNSGAKLPAGEFLTFKSNAPYLQSTDIRNQGGFFPEVHEDSFDYSVRLIQQIKEEVDRSVKIDISSSDDPANLLADLVSAAAIAPIVRIWAGTIASSTPFFSITGLPSGYEYIDWEFKNVTHDNSGTTPLSLRFMDASVVQTGSVYAQNGFHTNSTTTYTGVDATAGTEIQLHPAMAGTSASNQMTSGTIRTYNIKVADQVPTCKSSFHTHGQNLHLAEMSGGFNDSTPTGRNFDGIYLFPGAGNLTGGSIRIIGVK